MTRQRILRRRAAEARALITPTGQAIAIKTRPAVCLACGHPALVGVQGLCLTCLAKAAAARPRPLAGIDWDPLR